MKKRKRIIGIGIVLGIIVAGLILWPQPRLIRYTTTVWKTARERVKVTLLIPRSWQEEREEGRTEQDLISTSYVAFRITPTERYDWMPYWLRRLFGAHVIRHDSIEISFNVLISQTDMQAGIEKHKIGSNVFVSKSIDIGSGCLIFYANDDPREFEATYEAILNSAKVIRIPEKESGK